MKGKNIFLFICLLLGVKVSYGQQHTVIKGIVTDSISGEGLPYVSLKFKGTSIGTSTDLDGKFSLSAITPEEFLEISYIGYNTQKVKIAVGKQNELLIRLSQTSLKLNEVVVKPKKEKYQKKGNPAVEFVKQIIARKDLNSPYDHDYFCYDKYEKIVVAKNEYGAENGKKGKMKQFDFLKDFVDTLDVGTTVLPISEKERLETVLYRKNPKSEKRLVCGSKSSGVDEMLSRDGVQQFLNEVFHEVDIYENNIPLFLQRFVSPLSNIGPTFYKYYLIDTLEVDNQPCVDLGFTPFNSESFGFTGHLFVTLDSTYFVKKVILNVAKDINLNFVSRMTITQEFERFPNGTRIIMKDDINVDFKMFEGTKGFYARRLNIYSAHSLDRPSDKLLGVFDEESPVVIQEKAYKRSEKFWADVRPKEAVKKNSNSVDNMMTKLRSVPFYAVTEKILSTIVSGYIPLTENPLKNKFELGPMNSIINGNAIEGARFRLGGATTPVFNENLFFEGYVAYGTKDKKMKYNALVEYSFNDRKEYLREFPVHSLRFEYMYDINKLGQQYLYTSKDNIMLAIKRKRDTRATYLRRAELSYNREHYSGFSYNAIIRNKREYATDYADFRLIGTDGLLTPIKHYDMTELELRLRYAKNEKFYQGHDSRTPITFDALIFNLSHVMAKKGFLGSSFDYQRTDIGIHKRFWFSAFGYMDLITKAGKVWNKVPYPLLILPNANLSYTIQPEAYTNMNAMEFINDEYVSWDITYFMNGVLLNRMPLIKKLKWREVFCFRGLWGNLTDKNNPMKNGKGLYAFPIGSQMIGKTPYMEASVGIENIFKILRIDYVWRLNYLDNPNIQKRGIRCTFQMSF